RGIGHDPRLSPRQLAVVSLAKPERAPGDGELVDAHAMRRLVEIDVAGRLDRVVQDDRPVRLPAVEEMVAEEVAALADDAFLWLDHTRGQGCQSVHDLEG